MPEGFKELKDYLEKKNGREVKAEEIQTELQNTYGFTSGKITGIIKRAEEQGVIKKIRRGIYKLNIGEDNANCFDEKGNIYDLVNDEIKNCIGKIKNIIGKNFSELNEKDVERLQHKIKKLETISLERILSDEVNS